MNGQLQYASENNRPLVAILAIVTAVLISAMCLMGIVVGFVLPAVQAARMPPDPTMDKLHLIVVALQNYHNEYGSFPPAYVTDPSGKPMYSGRVLLLPFVGEPILYSQVDLNAAWDSSQNLSLSQRTVSAFQNPKNLNPIPGQTDFVFVTGNGTVFDPAFATRMNDIVDGASATIAVIEIKASGISWAEPMDFDLSKPAALPAGEDARGTIVAFVDGSVRLVPRTFAPQKVRAMATVDGGEPKIDF